MLLIFFLNFRLYHAVTKVYHAFLILKYSAYIRLSHKTRFQSEPIAALCLYNIQHENLVFKNSLCTKCRGLLLKLGYKFSFHYNEYYTRSSGRYPILLFVTLCLCYPFPFLLFTYPLITLDRL